MSTIPQKIEENHVVEGVNVLVRREDLRITRTPSKPFILHGKTASIAALFQSLDSHNVTGISCFASRGSDWALNAAIIAHAYMIPFTIYVQQPSLNLPAPWFIEVAQKERGARIEFVRPNHTPVMISIARKQAEARGDFFIPFGFEHAIAMCELTGRLRDFPKAATVVLCAGSGITLVCLLKAVLLDGNRFRRVVAVSSGRSRRNLRETVARHLTDLQIESATDVLEIEQLEGVYGASTIETAWQTHPFYERRVYAWLLKNIASLEQPLVFLNM